MRIFPFLIAMLILSGCAYTGEVVSIDTVVEEETDEPMPVEPAAADETSEETRDEMPVVQEEEEEVESEETAVETERVYEGIVRMQTGFSSYEVRITGNRDIRIFTREKLNAGDHIQFSMNDGGVVTSLVIVRQAFLHPSRYE